MCNSSLTQLVVSCLRTSTDTIKLVVCGDNFEIKDMRTPFSVIHDFGLVLCVYECVFLLILGMHKGNYIVLSSRNGNGSFRSYSSSDPGSFRSYSLSVRSFRPGSFRPDFRGG